MFQSICIKPNEITYPTDIGFIAENLLYYQKVHVVASTDTFPILLNNCGIDTLLELLTNRNLKILLRENLIGIASHQSGIEQSLTDVVLMSSESLKKEEMIFRGIFKATGRRGYSMRITQKLFPLIDTINYQNNICDLVREDLRNTNYIKQSIIEIINFYNPVLTLRPDEIEYEFVKTNEAYLFHTNLNYEEINKNIPNNPDGKIINPTGLMLNIMETRGDMHLAADLGAEIATTGIQTSLMKIKFHDIYNRTSKSSLDLYQFNDFILSNGHAIREVINNGDKSFDDFLSVLDKADRFKDWLKNIGDDKNILKEYHAAVTRETWVDKLPSKSFRWSFFTGVGLLADVMVTGGLGTVIGLGLSLGDAFLLDKVLKGWKPSVFVDKRLKSFAEIK